ncbi:hypothetical protein LguiB_006488 [Lonicera macranthoides]
MRFLAFKAVLTFIMKITLRKNYQFLNEGKGRNPEMAKQRKHMADWSQLPQDILGVIANRLGAIEDFVSFSSVCSSWRAAVLKEQWIPCVPQIPWLMVNLWKKRFLLNIERNKLYCVKDPLLKHNNGWMFKIEADLVQLTDPLTRFQITLLPFNSTKSIVKLVVSHRSNVTLSSLSCSMGVLDCGLLGRVSNNGLHYKMITIMTKIYI